MDPRRPAPAHPRLLALLPALLVGALAAACGSSTPSDAPARATAAAPDERSAAPDPTAFARAATTGAWRRSPVRPDPEFQAAVEEACRADKAIGEATLSVLDARGEGRAILVFDTGDGTVTCVADGGDTGSVTAEIHPVPGTAKAEPPGDGQLGVHDMFVVNAGGSAYSVLVGQYGPAGVKNVAANFDADAAWYTAASDNGWYAIWWPGEVKPLGVATSDNKSVVIDSYTP